MNDLENQLAQDMRDAEEWLLLPGTAFLFGEWDALAERADAAFDATGGPDEAKKMRAERGIYEILRRLPMAMARNARAAREMVSNPTPVLPALPGKKKPVDMAFLVAAASRFKTPHSKWTMESAVAAVHLAERIKAATAHPFWGRLMAIFAGFVFVFHEAFKMGLIVDDAACRAALNALPAPAVMADRLLRTGLEARAFLDEQVKASEGVGNAG